MTTKPVDRSLPVRGTAAGALERIGQGEWERADEAAQAIRALGDMPLSEDSALLAVFAARGLGVFPVSRFGASDVALMRGLRLLGPCDGVLEKIHAIRSRRGQHHPLVMQVVAAARP